MASFPGFRYRLSVSDVWEEVPVRRLLTVWLHSRLHHCSRTRTQVFSLLLKKSIILQQYLFLSGMIYVVRHYLFGVEYLIIFLLLCSFGCEHDGENNTCPEDGHVMNSTSARNAVLLLFWVLYKNFAAQTRQVEYRNSGYDLSPSLISHVISFLWS